MATRTISTKITLDNEKEFKQAISNINQSLGVLNSEMKKTSAEFQSDAKSVDALKAKGDVLERELLTQKEKLEAVKKALQNAEEQYGEADSRTLKWQKTLNDTQAEIYNTEQAIEENNEALENAEEGSVGLGEAVSDVASKFGIDLPDGVTNALDSVLKFSPEAAKAVAVVTAAVGATVKAVQELIEITKEAAQRVDDLNTTATQSGIDTYTLQVLNYMEKLADVNVSTVTSSMSKLIRNMNSARDGTGDVAEAFETLGVQITETDGTLRDSTDVFWETLDALEQIPDQTERDATAMTIFGKSAQDLNTLVKIGSDGFQEYANEAENAGYILEDKELSVLNEYQDAIDRATKAQDAMNQQMAVEMAPALTSLQESWSNLVTNGIQLLMDSGIIDFLSNLVTAISWVVDAFADLIDYVNALMNPLNSIIEIYKDLTGTVDENTEATATNGSALEYATDANDDFKKSVSGNTVVLNNTTAATNNATAALKQYIAYAEQAGLSGSISNSRLSELGTYSEANSERGSGYFNEYSNMSKAEFNALLKQNGITSASQISSVLGEDAYRYYAASAYYNASGDMNFKGGLTWVGESGKELVKLPQGSQIYSAQESSQLGGGNTFNITIDAKNVKEFNDIISIVKNSRVYSRMRG